MPNQSRAAAPQRLAHYIAAGLLVFLVYQPTVTARKYDIVATGKSDGKTPEFFGIGTSARWVSLTAFSSVMEHHTALHKLLVKHMIRLEIVFYSAAMNAYAGLNFANENSNPFHWLRYLGVNGARLFIQPFVASIDAENDRANWKRFISHSHSQARNDAYGNQFGVSFGGLPVIGRDSWVAAVTELRNLPKGREFFTWLLGQKAIDWHHVLKPLNTTGKGVSMAQLGNPTYVINKLRREGYQLVAVWDFRCKNIAYTSTDPSQPAYWQERWETYRLMYVGGRWLARMRVHNIELYNEPDKDTKCVDGQKWVDDARIRSQAVQDAFADYSLFIKRQLVPTIIGPSTAGGWKPPYSDVMLAYLNIPFPDNTPSDAFTLFNAYGFHKYGSFSSSSCSMLGSKCKTESGFGIRRNYDQTKERLVDFKNQPLPSLPDPGPPAAEPPSDGEEFSKVLEELQRRVSQQPAPGPVVVENDVWPQLEAPTPQVDTTWPPVEEEKEAVVRPAPAPAPPATYKAQSAVPLVRDPGQLPLYITEFNCLTAAKSESPAHEFFAGKHVFDETIIAACVAGQIANFVVRPDGPKMISLHKMVQNLVPRSPSRIGKNGVLYAHVDASPFIVTGSTKTGEAFRLLANRAAGGRAVWTFTERNNPSLMDISRSRFTVWAVEHKHTYHIFAANENWERHDVSLDLSKLSPPPFAGGTVVASAVAPNEGLAASLHGEVAFTMPLGANLSVHFDSPPGSVIALTVPKVPVWAGVVWATADATVRALGPSAGDSSQLEVSSSGSDVSVAVVRFPSFREALELDVGDVGMVSAVLELHLLSATNEKEQVLTVLGIKEDWKENAVTWISLTALRPLNGSLTDTTKNFIHWKDIHSVAGHITVPPASFIPATGTPLRLDVTDAVKQGVTSFLVVRMFRYDKSTGEPPSQLPADEIQGTAAFASRKNALREIQPRLLIDYEQLDELLPLPATPPAPEPISMNIAGGEDEFEISAPMPLIQADAADAPAPSYLTQDNRKVPAPVPAPAPQFLARRFGPLQAPSPATM